MEARLWQYSCLQVFRHNYHNHNDVIFITMVKLVMVMRVYHQEPIMTKPSWLVCFLQLTFPSQMGILSIPWFDLPMIALGNLTFVVTFLMGIWYVPRQQMIRSWNWRKDGCSAARSPTVWSRTTTYLSTTLGSGFDCWSWSRNIWSIQYSLKIIMISDQIIVSRKILHMIASPFPSVWHTLRGLNKINEWQSRYLAPQVL